MKALRFHASAIHPLKSSCLFISALGVCVLLFVCKAAMPARRCCVVATEPSTSEPACPAFGASSNPQHGADYAFVRRLIGSAPLFLADAFAPALLLHPPPAGVQTLHPYRYNFSAQVLQVAEGFVRNATRPATPLSFRTCAVVGSDAGLRGQRWGRCIDSAGS